MKERTYIVITAVLSFLMGVLLTLLVTSFLTGGVRRTGEYKVPEGETASNGVLTDIAMEVSARLKSGDFEALSELVHPDYGVVFSPFPTVNLSANQRFTPEEVADFGRNERKLTWGLNADGGEPISLTVREYMARYVFDHDYTNSPLVGLNYPVRTGNARENVTESFPGAQFVDLCYPGTPESEYADWRILRLVFEEYDGELKLTAVIHSEPTL